MLDGLWEFMYAGGKVVIPTIERTDGPWLTVEPIDVVDWADRSGLQARIAAQIRSPNPKGKLPRSFPRAPSPLAKAAGFRSDRQFEREALGWAVERKGEVYRIVPYKRPPRGPGWLEDGDNAVVLPPGASPEMTAAKLIEIIEAAISQA
jgi:hypothetical protein